MHAAPKCRSHIENHLDLLHIIYLIHSKLTVKQLIQICINFDMNSDFVFRFNAQEKLYVFPCAWYMAWNSCGGWCHPTIIAYSATQLQTSKMVPPHTASFHIHHIFVLTQTNQKLKVLNKVKAHTHTLIQIFIRVSYLSFNM